MLLFLFHIISYDVWFYLTHLLLHSKSFYWIHKKHHEKANPIFLDTYYDHWLESPIQASGFLVPYALFAFDPIQTTCALVLINARGMLMHDPRGTFITGDHHLIHHKLSNCNYGQPWIDYLMNTNHKPVKTLEDVSYHTQADQPPPSNQPQLSSQSSE
jgi:sterol desaturase/sphingolipid hydroxylase (fatty acid hydroxylase superfamily)